MAIAITVVRATSAAQPNAITVTGLAPAQVVTFMRATPTAVERIAGKFTADTSGVVAQPDYLYPFDVALIYHVYDSTGLTLLASSASVAAVPSGGTPWIRDVIYPMLRYVAVTIVDVTGRTRAGRINPYYVVAQTYATATGDVRSGSTGQLQLFCRSHDERDAALYAMSTGNPCLLRVPGPCRTVVDEMTFAPMDVDEIRVGTAGACLLTVAFVEVDPSKVGTFTATSYATQTQNAVAVDLRYGSLLPAPTGLSAAFVGKTYRDLYLSPTGITP